MARTIAHRKGKKHTKLYAGGVGSGCHGPNCGRPKGPDNNDVIHKLEGKAFMNEALKKADAMLTEKGWIKPYMTEEFFNQTIGKSFASQIENIFSDWKEEPVEVVQKEAQKVVNGDITDPIDKAFAIQAAITQAALLKENKGKETITLYRGVDGEYARSITKALDGSDTITVKLRGADSWTTNKETASIFGGVIIKADVPIKYVIANNKTSQMLDAADEQEHIVAFPKGELTITYGQVDTEYTSTVKMDWDKYHSYGKVNAAAAVLDLTSDHHANWLRSTRDIDAFTDGGGYAVYDGAGGEGYPPSLKEPAAIDVKRKAARRDALWYELAKNNFTPNGTASPRSVNSYPMGVLAKAAKRRRKSV